MVTPFIFVGPALGHPNIAAKSRFRFSRHINKFLIYAMTVWGAVTNAAANQADLTELSLEQLMNVKVTSVSKKPQRVSESAAAVHVITAGQTHQ